MDGACYVFRIETHFPNWWEIVGMKHSTQKTRFCRLSYTHHDWSWGPYHILTYPIRLFFATFLRSTIVTHNTATSTLVVFNCFQKRFDGAAPGPKIILPYFTWNSHACEFVSEAVATEAGATLHRANTALHRLSVAPLAVQQNQNPSYDTVANRTHGVQTSTVWTWRSLKRFLQPMLNKRPFIQLVMMLISFNHGMQFRAIVQKPTISIIYWTNSEVRQLSSIHNDSSGSVDTCLTRGFCGQVQFLPRVGRVGAQKDEPPDPNTWTQKHGETKIHVSTLAVTDCLFGSSWHCFIFWFLLNPTIANNLSSWQANQWKKSSTFLP